MYGLVGVDDIAVQVAAAGAIPFLVEVLSATTSAEVPEWAALALFRLARFDVIAVQVAAACAIPPLVALLSATNPAIVRAKAALPPSVSEGTWLSFPTTVWR